LIPFRYQRWRINILDEALCGLPSSSQRERPVLDMAAKKTGLGMNRTESPKSIQQVEAFQVKSAMACGSIGTPRPMDDGIVMRADVFSIPRSGCPTAIYVYASTRAARAARGRDRSSFPERDQRKVERENAVAEYWRRNSIASAFAVSRCSARRWLTRACPNATGRSPSEGDGCWQHETSGNLSVRRRRTLSPPVPSRNVRNASITSDAPSSALTPVLTRVSVR